MLRLGIGLLLLATIVAASDEEGYDGFKLFEIVPKTQQQSDFLYDLSKQDELYDFFVLRRTANKPAQVMVHRNEISNFVNKLALQKIDFRVLNEDVGRSVENNFKLNMLKRQLRHTTNTGRLSTDRFYNHTEINSYMEYLAECYPSRVVVTKVRRSYMGREIKTMIISNGDGRTNKKVILIDAGMHAREWISQSTILFVMEQLVENFKDNEELLLNYDFVILPVVNPDGYDYTHISPKTRLWRKTRRPYAFKGKVCHGSDPNRNFACHWNEGGASSNPCSNTYAGPHAFSEPETVILRDVMHSLRSRGIFYLTLHSYGNYLIYPWSWTFDFPDGVADMDEIATIGANAIFKATDSQYTTGTTTSVLHIASGSSDDYAYQTGFKIAITMELPGESFTPDPSEIGIMVEEAWIGIRAMCKRVIDKYSA